jgi:hypothetical protein
VLGHCATAVTNAAHAPGQRRTPLVLGDLAMVRQDKLI